MSSETRWRWAGIVSAISVGGVLITDIVANVVGGYISEQIKTWDVPDKTPAAQTAPANADETVSSIPPQGSEGAVTMAAVDACSETHLVTAAALLPSRIINRERKIACRMACAWAAMVFFR